MDTAHERVEYQRLADMPGVEVLRAERCARRWRVYHETYAVCVITDDSGIGGSWSYRGKIHPMRAGGLMLIEPGEVHSNPDPLPPADFRALFLAPSFVEDAAVALGLSSRLPHFTRAFTTDPDLFRTFENLHQSLETPSSRLERESRLAHCVRRLIGQYSETGAPVSRRPARSVLLRARDLIRELYSSPITLDDLVAVTGLSRYHVLRAFTKEFGLPPHAYQIRVQVEKARTLLASGIAPAQVAADLGFADQSHFTRHFKRINGVTPGQYAKGRSA